MPNNIPISTAPRIYSPNLMTGKLIPVNSSKAPAAPAVDASGAESESFFDRFLGSSEKSGHPGDMELNTYNNSSPSLLSQFLNYGKELFAGKPKENTFFYSPSKTSIHKSLHQVKSVPTSNQNGFLQNVGTGLDDLYKSAGKAWDNATPMERGLAIGIPTALAAGAGALYLRKKQREANRSSKK